MEGVHLGVFAKSAEAIGKRGDKFRSCAEERGSEEEELISERPACIPPPRAFCIVIRRKGLREGVVG